MSFRTLILLALVGVLAACGIDGPPIQPGSPEDLAEEDGSAS